MVTANRLGSALNSTRYLPSKRNSRCATLFVRSVFRFLLSANGPRDSRSIAF